MTEKSPVPFIVIACGGTGGHLFPGLAVAEELVAQRCRVTLMVSRKDVDQQAVKAAAGMEVVTLPAVGWSARRGFRFAWGLWQSYRLCARQFRSRPPHAVLAMGGFTSAGPVLAGRAAGALTFLHESNTVAGRANRWLAAVADEAFTWFPQTAASLRRVPATVVGMPVRAQFEPLDPAACKQALGLDPRKPVLLVVGGSQGARGINDLLLEALPHLAVIAPDLQYLHLTGREDCDRVRAAYAGFRRKAVVRPFLTEMETALGAATAAISRAGASSLAEFAAMRVPALLVPYPSAADNHQLSNARAFVETNAARLMEQHEARPERLNWAVLELIGNRVTREAMGCALAKWHQPGAAGVIADRMLRAIRTRLAGRLSGGPGVEAEKVLTDR